MNIDFPLILVILVFGSGLVWLALDGFEILLRKGSPPQPESRYENGRAGIVLYTENLHDAAQTLSANGLIFKGTIDTENCLTFTDDGDAHVVARQQKRLGIGGHQISAGDQNVAFAGHIGFRDPDRTVGKFKDRDVIITHWRHGDPRGDGKAVVDGFDRASDIADAGGFRDQVQRRVTKLRTRVHRFLLRKGWIET